MKDDKKKIVKAKGKDRKPFQHERKDKDVVDEVRRGSMNDPRWYYVNDDLMRASASLPFSQWIGRGLNVSGPAVTGAPYESLVLSIPYFISIGQSNGEDAPFNLAVRNLYTYVRHANSGHTNYESADLGIYLLAVGDAIAFATHVERILGVAKYYQVRNAFVPNTLLNALGVTDPANLMANLANYTAQLNVQWARLSSLCLPTSFNFIKRWIWMNSQVFKDHESDKAAMFAFVPSLDTVYEPSAINTGGSIKLASSGTNLAASFSGTIAAILNSLEARVSAILRDEDMNIMSGDILKAYGADNLIKFGSTPLDYTCEPKYVEEMLPQIHNMRTLPCFTTNTGFVRSGMFSCVSYDSAAKLGVTDATTLSNALGAPRIYQVGGEIVECHSPSFGPGITVSTTYGSSYAYDTSDDGVRPGHDLVLNSFEARPTPEDVTISTRLQFTYTFDGRTSSHAWYIASSGTEVVPYFTLYYCGPHGTPVLSYTFGTDVVYSNSAASQCQLVMNAIFDSVQLDWFPLIYVMRKTSGTDAIADLQSVVGDIDNFTIVSDETSTAINQNAILGEFTVTSLNFLKVN